MGAAPAQKADRREFQICAGLFDHPSDRTGVARKPCQLCWTANSPSLPPFFSSPPSVRSLPLPLSLSPSLCQLLETKTLVLVCFLLALLACTSLMFSFSCTRSECSR